MLSGHVASASGMSAAGVSVGGVSVGRVAGGRVLDGDDWIERSLGVDAGTIAAAAGSGVVVDAAGRRVGPGFVDLQINGGFGIDLQADPTRLWELAARLPELGVTAFLPTLTTNGHARVSEALDAWQTGRPFGFCGSEPLGWHLEGPWLHPERRGAHRAERLAPIPSCLPEGFRPEHGVSLVTLAPDLLGAEAATRMLVDRGVVVSFGHSPVSAADAERAYGWGARMGTHLFNAMGGLHHRHPGLAATLLRGAAPTSRLAPQPFVGLIADGEHVTSEMVDLAWRLAGDRIVVVSDAVAPLGHTDAAVFRLADGTLAGAVIGLDRAVVNLVSFTGCSQAQAHRAASSMPARVLGLADRSTLDAGRRADLVVLDDDGSVYATVIAGRLAYRRR